MGKAELKKIPDKLTDAEKKKVKNENKVSHDSFIPAAVSVLSCALRPVFFSLLLQGPVLWSGGGSGHCCGCVLESVLESVQIGTSSVSKLRRAHDFGLQIRRSRVVGFDLNASHLGGKNPYCPHYTPSCYYELVCSIDERPTDQPVTLLHKRLNRCEHI